MAARQATPALLRCAAGLACAGCAAALTLFSLPVSRHQRRQPAREKGRCPRGCWDGWWADSSALSALMAHLRIGLFSALPVHSQYHDCRGGDEHVAAGRCNSRRLAPAQWSAHEIIGFGASFRSHCDLHNKALWRERGSELELHSLHAPALADSGTPAGLYPAPRVSWARPNKWNSRRASAPAAEATSSTQWSTGRRRGSRPRRCWYSTRGLESMWGATKSVSS